MRDVVKEPDSESFFVWSHGDSQFPEPADMLRHIADQHPEPVSREDLAYLWEPPLAAGGSSFGTYLGRLTANWAIRRAPSPCFRRRNIAASCLDRDSRRVAGLDGSGRGARVDHKEPGAAE